MADHALSDTMSFKVETLNFAPADNDEFSQYPVEDCTGPDGFDGGDCGMIGADTNVSIKAGISFAF